MASALHPTPEMVAEAQRVLMDGGTVEDMLIAVTPMIATAVMSEALAEVKALQGREVVREYLDAIGAQPLDDDTEGGEHNELGI